MPKLELSFHTDPEAKQEVVVIQLEFLAIVYMTYLLFVHTSIMNVQDVVDKAYTLPRYSRLKLCLIDLYKALLPPHRVIKYCFCVIAFCLN